MKLNWLDFNIGLVVETRDGNGIVMLVDGNSNKIGVRLFDGEYKTFNIEDISLRFGSLNISLTFQIGQYILLFQRIENRLKNMINDLLELKDVQQQSLTGTLTAGKLIGTVNLLVKTNANENNKKEWAEINAKLLEHNKIRNTIIHGFLFHYNENHELDFDKIKILNANGNIELLNFNKLDELNKSVVETYYQVNNFIVSNSIEIMRKINNS